MADVVSCFKPNGTALQFSFIRFIAEFLKAGAGRFYSPTADDMIPLALREM
jgi:hypothetical protein